jgi:dihydropteroate synthase
MGISRVEDTHFPKSKYLRVQDKLIDLSIPKVMGIVNVTPDSFYSSSRKTNDKELLGTVHQMIEDGADFIDLGGFSSRPGAEIISEEEELKRVLKPIAMIKKEFPTCILSLDTFRAVVAEKGIDNGVNIINDISGWQYDPKLLDVIAKHKIPYILMHSGKSFSEMHKSSKNDMLFRNMIYYFSEKLQHLTKLGLVDIIIDPGFGFSKTIEQNYDLLSKLELFHILDRPILIGLSRKSMIYKKLNMSAEESINGSTILNTQAVIKGASILRVHDVKEAKQIINLLY